MMTRKIFNQLKHLCINYDPFTQYIDSHRQKESAEKRNRRVEEEFQSILREYANAEADYFIPWRCENCHGEELEKELLKYLSELEIEVEPRHIWTEKEIEDMVQTNNQVLINVLRKTSLYTSKGAFLSKPDQKSLRTIFNFWLDNDKITNDQAATARQIFARYTSELTALANELD